jgi:diketogulonate reductase-like aldo/keto reductase
MHTATASEIRTISLRTGETVPVLGQGTWYLGEDPKRHKEEIRTLRLGIDLGMTLIDTAEMYGGGAAERLVGEAIKGHREEVFLVTKVLPQHASRSGTITACEGSLRRLKTNRIDLYLLHWRERFRLEETLLAFSALTKEGKIRYWGVSNFDVLDLEDLLAIAGGDAVVTNQVLYNLARRGIEWDLLPYCKDHGIPVMAYSPIDQGRVLLHPDVQRIAERHHATRAQVALAWVLRAGVIAIPRAGTPEHVQDNRAALDVLLTEEDMAELDRAFPPPTARRPLEML